METLLDDVLRSHSMKDVATQLGLCIGTVRRWQELNSVPDQYKFDLLKILGREIDYSEYTSKEKDQFFTPSAIARQCWETFLRVTSISPQEYCFIEPSAGDGSFLQHLPPGSIGMDIEPRNDRIQKQDFLTWVPPADGRKYAVVGNPPFGLRGHLALKFINHSYQFADYVAFVLPQLFESDGKGSPRKRVIGFNLIHSEKLTTDFVTPEKTLVSVNCVFQVWSKIDNNPEYDLSTNTSTELTVYSLSDGGTVATTRNKRMIGACDIYLPSTCFGRDAMKVYSSFDELPNRKGYGVVFNKNKDIRMLEASRINWADVSFLSTNSAFNLRTSIILKQFDPSRTSPTPPSEPNSSP